MKVWLKVTNDKYELPVQIADSGKELAIKCGVSYTTLKNAMSRDRTGKSKKGCVYKCVDIGEEA